MHLVEVITSVRPRTPEGVETHYEPCLKINSNPLAGEIRTQKF
jgi:hypothetical protein